MINQGSVIRRGSYKHQGDWITSLACSNDHVVSASRDKTVCIWDINEVDTERFISPHHLLTGHNHIVQDLCLSTDGQYAISASWDKTLRLWDLNANSSIARFEGHKHDVLSVSLSKDNRQIISAGRDKTIKLWNIFGECKYTTPETPEWITSVKFVLAEETGPIISAGYDRLIRVWDRNTFQQKFALKGHTGYINSIAVSPDGTIVASGGRDARINFYDIKKGEHVKTITTNEEINCLTYSPNRSWIAAATNSSLKIYSTVKYDVIAEINLQQQFYETNEAAMKEEEGTKKSIKVPKCISVTFSADGMNIMAGYTDASIRCWNLPASSI